MVPFLDAHADPKTIAATRGETIAATRGEGSASMTKADLVERLAQKKKMTRQHAELVVDAVFGTAGGEFVIIHVPALRSPWPPGPSWRTASG